MNGASWFEPVRLSLATAAVAGTLAFVLAAFAAWKMTRVRFPGQAAVETLFLLPLVLPPTVVGFALLVAFGRRSWVGAAYERLLGQPLVFSAVVAFPLAYQTAKAGFAAVDRDLTDAARSIGASEWQLLRYVAAPLAARALGAAFVLGFARALGEFGATLMVAGAIPGRTLTLPTAIYLAVETGNEAQAWTWCAAIAAIGFALLLAARAFHAREA
ncbi:molybdate ABC transporter permease subunit [Paenibacillus sp.]|uniref:molybdate ABC transporter permease subunit n=1 Tax=Paenibacillus sp. TaxID=58172 RepID=UPI002D24E0CE|nr:molybdate ABC transporter permease subunit [Paenibacillus sp.]HZG58528.1 molybdate ABC transporter permease subunit [Paenibacillus sp.]